MRVGIKAKQVLGVTLIVATVVVILSVMSLAQLAQVSLDESRARAELLAKALYHRAHDIAVPGVEPAEAFRSDGGLRSILESSLYSPNVTFAAMADTRGVAIVHSDPEFEGKPLGEADDLAALGARSPIEQLRVIYADQGRNFELKLPLLLGDTTIGSIRIGVSTLLVRRELTRSMQPAIVSALIALAVAIVGALVLAQLLLKPIHVIRSGLTRLGKGEFGVQLDLHQDDEFGELGTSFNAVSEQLSQGTTGESTARYSRKLAALGRLSAGVAHEVKNPLNAMMIHLELLRQQVQATSSGPDSLGHVDTIAGEIRRLDEVMQVFLKFARPEDLVLQPVSLQVLFNDVMPIVRPEADKTGVRLVLECDAPDVNGDPGMLRQAFLNLALNACQAMPDGGTLTVRCEPARGHRVSVTVSDTGIGIKPEHLQRIFDLYFTTKPKGSGIGLSMVFRTVQMHDGEIDVESIPGTGTTFKVLLPQA